LSKSSLVAHFSAICLSAYDTPPNPRPGTCNSITRPISQALLLADGLELAADSSLPDVAALTDVGASLSSLVAILAPTSSPNTCFTSSVAFLSKASCLAPYSSSLPLERFLTGAHSLWPSDT
jgi:hypothetical protein